MGELRNCVYFLVLLVAFQRTFATPIFGSSFLCSLFCDDDGDGDSGGSFVDDLFSLFDDSSEETSTPDVSSPRPTANNGKPQEISLLIPPASGMNLTLQSLGSSLWLSLFPWAGGGSAASTTAAPPTTTTPAGNSTAANATAAG